jgi:hypothetical protein
MVEVNGKVLAVAVEALYRDREATFQRQADAEARRSLALSRARLAMFVAAAIALLAALASEADLRGFLFLVAAVAAALFAALVVVHGRIEDRLDRERTLVRINRDQLSRNERAWATLPSPAVPAAPETHPYAHDLDVAGRASLLSLCRAAGTAQGLRHLYAWLLSPANLPTILARQQAVTELAPLIDFRQELLARAMLAHQGSAADPAALERFFTWAEGAPWLISRPWVVWIARLLGFAATVLALAHATGFISEALWLLPVLVNIVLWFLLVRRIESSFNHAFQRSAAPGQEAVMFTAACRQEVHAPLLTALRARLSGADAAMRRLQRLMELADIRLTTLVHFPLNALTLWDFHVLAAVERWQVTCGRRVRDWFEAMGDIEALSGFAGLKFDNPQWAMPEFVDAAGDPAVEAIALGHPLLPERVRVTNDVRVGPPGTFLFVTGSNMSGKSTLLRAIGVNAVLAHAGAPVCATSFRLPLLEVYTSMRVQDSLEDGVSYFMAALKRLKLILEEARQASRGRVLYLLDEILQGTNTAERQIAVRTILGQLLEAGAIGAVTSHDLNLADAEDLSRAAVPVHFTEHFHEGPDGMSMQFDYRLRPGVATSRNALKLMKMIGIEAPPAPSEPTRVARTPSK